MFSTSKKVRKSTIAAAEKTYNATKIKQNLPVEADLGLKKKVKPAYSFENAGKKLDKFISQTGRDFKAMRLKIQHKKTVVEWVEENGLKSACILSFVIGMFFYSAVTNFWTIKTSTTAAYAQEPVEQANVGFRTPAGAAGELNDPVVVPSRDNSELLEIEDPQAAAFMEQLAQVERVPELRKVDKYAIDLAVDFEKAKDVPKPYMEPDNGRINFFFGTMNPKIVCRPLRLTDIELEPNERIVDDSINVADSSRWTVTTGQSGTDAYLVTHVMVRPTVPNIATNMIIHTDKRTYSIELVSVASGQYMQRVGFNYPTPGISADNAAKGSGKQQVSGSTKAAYAKQDAVRAEKKKNALRAKQHKIDVSKINKNYSINKAKGRKPAWMPIAVYDMGGKTYIKLDPNVAITEAPALFAIRDGKEKLVNYRVHKNWYIVDCLFEKAMMKVGGSKVVIKRATPITASKKTAKTETESE